MAIYKIENNIYAKDTGVYGKSLFAVRDFKKGENVFVAFGPIMYKSNDYTIPIGFDSGKKQYVLIEPRIPEGNLCQFICHSCDPNLGIKDRTLFVAMRDIKKDEEVTIDYAMIVPSFEYKFAEVKWEDRTCLCGREKCRGEVRGYFELTDAEKKKYEGYVSDFILEMDN